MKLFVTDIDGTLSIGEMVSEEVQSSCKRLKDAGWDIMIATGRTFGTAKRHMKAAGATQPAIVYDGGRLMSLEGEEIHSELFDPALAEKILDSLWPLPVEIQITGDEFIHCREGDAVTIDFYRKAGVPLHCVAVPVPPASSPVYRIGLWMDPEKLPAVENQVRELFGSAAEITSGGQEFLDILPKGVSKRSALEYFISTLPKRPDLIVAAGDYDNDLAMLRFADVAAVPRTASCNALPLADVVIPGAAENGISALVSHMLSSRFPSSREEKDAEKGRPVML